MTVSAHDWVWRLVGGGNPYHDELGRFTHSPRGDGGTVTKERAAPLSTDALVVNGRWPPTDSRLQAIGQHAADAGYTKIAAMPEGERRPIAGTDVREPDTLLVGTQQKWDSVTGVEMMPEAQQDLVRYTVMHEAGHRFAIRKYTNPATAAGPEHLRRQLTTEMYDIQYEVLRDTATDASPAQIAGIPWELMGNMGMSRYGQSAPGEAYAEAHAAWQMGNTSTLVEAYAEHEGWVKL